MFRMKRKDSASDRINTRIRRIFQKTEQRDPIRTDRGAEFDFKAPKTAEPTTSIPNLPTPAKSSIRWIHRFRIPKSPRRSPPCPPSEQLRQFTSSKANNVEAEVCDRNEHHSDARLKSPNSSTYPMSDDTIVGSPSSRQSESETLVTTPDTASQPRTPPEQHSHAFPPIEPVSHRDFEAAVANLRAAELLLDRRHQNIKVQPNFSKKLKPFLPPSNVPDQMANAALSSHPPDVTSHIDLTAPQTADEVNNTLQRRRLIRRLAYNAATGCPTASAVIEQVKSHFIVKSQYPGMKDCGLIVTIEGVHVHVDQLGMVERNWIDRCIVIAELISLADRRHVHADDYETILTQLFPKERVHILKPEEFKIFLAGLAEEGILTRGQAKIIARLKVDIEEFVQGAYFAGLPQQSQQHSNNLRDIVLFHMPNELTRSISFPPVRSTIKGLFHQINLLAEAAVYNQKYWKGYYFPDARSTLSNFYEAYMIDQDDWLLPPYLTQYKRTWSYRETRVLLRAHLICDLLKRYESGDITDFGIIRIIRATYVRIPAQPYFSLEELQSFLYHRIADSGLPISKIPDILALHPENDVPFSDSRLRTQVLKTLKDNAQHFEEEEKDRLKSIEFSHATFMSARKAQMNLWQRAKLGCKQAFGRKDKIVPFDPFAPEH